MSFFARQIVIPVLILTLITILTNPGSTNGEMTYKSRRTKDRYERIKPREQKSTILDPETLLKARRTISHLSPEARKFLFSPTIQNTITNLNHNSNTMKMKSGDSDEPSRQRDPEQILGYMDPESETVEYDLTGKVKKICFIIG